MIRTTTQSIEGQTIREYKGIVVGEAVMGAYEQKLADDRQIAGAELVDEASARDTNGVVGVNLDYEVVGESMFMVPMSGTAVVVA